MECPRLTLDRLQVVSVRNVVRADLTLAPRVNVFHGANGAGKTSLLEAVYMVATSRSFRTSKLAELVNHGETLASVRATFVEGWSAGPLTRVQTVGLQGGRRTVKVDGKRPPSLAAYATRSPVVVFDPQQLTLSTGPASERRRLLDRVTLFMHPELATHRTRYTQALRGRQRVLADHGPRATGPLTAFEHLLADHGAAITRARADAVGSLSREVLHAFGRIAAPDLHLTVAYDMRGSDDPERGRRELFERRAQDAKRKQSSFGPHRDDLALRLDEHPVRVVASQGQHRAVTLALKAAELAAIAAARGVHPILLLDDVSSELDESRTAALFDHLANTQSQIVITTTRPGLIVTPHAPGEARHDFAIEAGKVVRSG